MRFKPRCHLSNLCDTDFDDVSSETFFSNGFKKSDKKSYNNKICKNKIEIIITFIIKLLIFFFFDYEIFGIPHKICDN